MADTASGNNPSTLEFRGVFFDHGEYFFSLHDPASRSSQWVGLNEAGQPYAVESYDNAKGSIQVKFRGQVMTLSLKQAQIIVHVAPSPASTPTPPGPTVANSSSSNEASRLAQVAEEIRRRRALRTSGPVPKQNAVANPPRPGPLPAKP